MRIPRLVSALLLGLCAAGSGWCAPGGPRIVEATIVRTLVRGVDNPANQRRGKTRGPTAADRAGAWKQRVSLTLSDTADEPLASLQLRDPSGTSYKLSLPTEWMQVGQERQWQVIWERACGSEKPGWALRDHGEGRGRDAGTR